MIPEIMVDRLTFRWQTLENDCSEFYKPIVWEYEGLFYQINFFDDLSNNFIINDKLTPVEALNLSLKLYPTDIYRLNHLNKIYKICKKFSIDPSKFDIFEKNGIKGKEAFASLEYIDNLSEKLVKYCDEKKIGIRYITILRKLNQNHQNLIEHFIEANKPSASELRNFINFVKDYKNFIETSQYNHDHLNFIKYKQNHLQEDFLKQFNTIIKNLKYSSIENKYNFEKPYITISSEIR
ncbi:MAG: hypothetical protein K6348_04260, partial [Deferribacterales bacterium]